MNRPVVDKSRHCYGIITLIHPSPGVLSEIAVNESYLGAVSSDRKPCTMDCIRKNRYWRSYAFPIGFGRNHSDVVRGSRGRIHFGSLFPSSAAVAHAERNPRPITASLLDPGAHRGRDCSDYRGTVPICRSSAQRSSAPPSRDGVFVSECRVSGRLRWLGAVLGHSRVRREWVD